MGIWHCLRAALGCGATLVGLAGCGDPAERFIAKMDAAPPEQQLPDWSTTRRLMLRPAPAVGQPAPDFTLPALEGGGAVTRSVFQGDRPLVLVFGSFT